MCQDGEAKEMVVGWTCSWEENGQKCMQIIDSKERLQLDGVLAHFPYFQGTRLGPLCACEPTPLIYF
jgi:hypothetical protein